MSRGVSLYVGNRSPSLADVIAIDGDPFDLTGSTVKFQMRKEGAPSGTLEVDAAAVVVQSGVVPNIVNQGAVRYDWAALDVDTAGYYQGWWRVTLPGAKTQDTPEFAVTIQDHSDAPSTNLTNLQSAREFVLRDADDASQDSQLIRLIKAYSAAVAAYTRREWLPAVDGETRLFQYDGAGFLSLDPFDLRAIDTVVLYSDLDVLDQRLLDPSEYRMMPANKTALLTYGSIQLPGASNLGGISNVYNNPSPYGPVGLSSPGSPVPYYEVAVLGDWGIGTVPDDVELAVLIAVDDAYKNPTGFAAGNIGGLEFSELADTDPGAYRARNLPVESRGLLTPYKRGTDVVVA